MEAPWHSPGRWIADGRGEGRAVRVSVHAEGGFLLLSTWKSGTCTGTVRLLPAEAAELVGHLAWALAGLAPPLADLAVPAGAGSSRGRLARALDRLRGRAGRSSGGPRALQP